MKNIEKAIETTATISADHQLVLDEPLPIPGPARVRVIVLFPELAKFEEGEWLLAGCTNKALDFLQEPAEDIYSPTEGRPFDDQRLGGFSPLSL